MEESQLTPQQRKKLEDVNFKVATLIMKELGIGFNEYGNGNASTFIASSIKSLIIKHK